MLIIVAESLGVALGSHTAPELCLLLSALPNSFLSMWSANCLLYLGLYFTKFDNKTISLPAGIFADYFKNIISWKKYLAIFNYTMFHTCIIKKN